MKPSSDKAGAFKKMLAHTKQIRDEQDAKSKTFEKVDWFIPAKGDNSIRILPHTEDESKPFYRQVQTHFMPIKKKDGSYAKIPVRCLQDFEEECPICKAFTKMVKSDNAKKKEEANWLRPSTKFLVNVINYAERKVQPYAMASTVFREITGWMEEFGTPIYDLDEGRDFKVIKSVKGGKTEYAVRPSLKDTAVPDKLRPLIDTAPKLADLYKENEKARMLAYVSDLLGEEEDDDEVEEEDEEPIRKSKGKAKAEVEEDEEEEEEEESPKAKALKAKVKAKAKAEEEEEDEEEEEEPAPKKKITMKKKAKDEDDEDIEDDVDLTDDDLDKEFEDLNV